MKYKKYVVLGSALALVSIFIAFPTSVAAATAALEADLLPGEFRGISGPNQNNDYLRWNFTSTLADIMVVMMNNLEFDNFIDYDIFSYTALLNNDKRTDSGWWRPPYSDIWHILFINDGTFETHLVYYAVRYENYFSKNILSNDLIIGYIGFVMVLGIGSVSMLIQHSKLKRV